MLHGFVNSVPKTEFRAADFHSLTIYLTWNSSRDDPYKHEILRGWSGGCFRHKIAPYTAAPNTTIPHLRGNNLSLLVADFRTR